MLCYRKKIQKGFTLIEISIVMGIIAVLSAVILVNVGAARKKGNDADIKANLAIIQSRAEVYYDLNKSYRYETDSCGTEDLFSEIDGNPTDGGPPVDLIIVRARYNAEKASGEGAVCVARDNHVSANGYTAKSYAIAVRLRQDTTKWWCVDSSGTSSSTTAASYLDVDLTVGSGNAETAKCP